MKWRSAIHIDDGAGLPTSVMSRICMCYYVCACVEMFICIFLSSSICIMYNIIYYILDFYLYIY